MSRITALQQQKATTLVQIQTAPDQSTVQKLTAQVSAIDGQVAQLGQQQQTATDQIVTQNISNQNDQQMKAQAANQAANHRIECFPSELHAVGRPDQQRSHGVQMSRRHHFRPAGHSYRELTATVQESASDLIDHQMKRDRERFSYEKQKLVLLILIALSLWIMFFLLWKSSMTFVQAIPRPLRSTTRLPHFLNPARKNPSPFTTYDH